MLFGRDAAKKYLTAAAQDRSMDIVEETGLKGKVHHPARSDSRFQE